MTKREFALLTALLGVVTMGGAGYIAYASTSPEKPSADRGPAAAGSSSGAVTLPSSGASTQSSTGASATTGAVECVNGDIKITEKPGQGAAGHVSLLLVFQNVSGHACYLHGYPGASLTGSDGTDLLDATRTLSGYLGGAVGLSKTPDVQLAAGERASAVLEWSDVRSSSEPGGCEVQNAANLVVTPPDFTQSATLTFAAGAQVCSGFEIHPVLKGVVSEPGD